MKIKAVLDTNVVISGIFWKGPPSEILEAWQKQPNGPKFESVAVLEMAATA